MTAAKPLAIVAAMAQNHVIGRGLDIPWKIPGEMKRFKELTVGKTIIMGRKTYDSIGRPLPQRRTIVVSRDPSLHIDGCDSATSLSQALTLAQDDPHVLIAGGGQIYQEALPLCRTLHLTVIHRDIDGDIHFPTFDWHDYHISYQQKIDGEDPYTYYTLERKL